jgi:hypothetical protein
MGLHQPTTGGTDRLLLPAGLAQISCPTGQSQVLEHTGTKLGPPFVHRRFNLLQSRLGVVEPPFLEAHDHLFT